MVESTTFAQTKQQSSFQLAQTKVLLQIKIKKKKTVYSSWRKKTTVKDKKTSFFKYCKMFNKLYFSDFNLQLGFAFWFLNNFSLAAQLLIPIVMHKPTVMNLVTKKHE